MEALTDQGSSENQKSGVLSKGFEGMAIEEGSRTQVQNTFLKRSRILRKMAVAHFSDASGSIASKGCGFIAEDFYGVEARGLIEIHHRKPLFLHEGSQLRTSLRDALKYVVPLCSNSHRIVHSDRSRCMPICELRRMVERMRDESQVHHGVAAIR